MPIPRPEGRACPCGPGGTCPVGGDRRVSPGPRAGHVQPSHSRSQEGPSQGIAVPGSMGHDKQARNPARAAPQPRPRPGVRPLHPHEPPVAGHVPRRRHGRRPGGLHPGRLHRRAPSATATATAAPTPASAAAATASASASASPTLTRAIAECGVEIPEETAGPYPGDGSNGPNVLEASGVVRQDITSSFGTSTTRADGVPLTVTLTLLDNANGCVRWPAPPSTPGTATGTASTPCTIPGSERELPPRRPGGRRQRPGHLPDHLPGRVQRPLAAHPLRSLRVHEQRHGRRAGPRGVPDRADRGRLQGGLRLGRLRDPAPGTSPGPR